jgi:hypothetical protein
VMNLSYAASRRYVSRCARVDWQLRAHPPQPAPDKALAGTECHHEAL